MAIFIAPAMAIDFTMPLTQLDGKPFTDESGKAIELTLGSASENALLKVYQDEPNLAGEEKVKRYLLAVKIHDKTNVDLNSDEISILKKLIGKSYSAAVVGEAWTALDPASVK